MVFVGLGGSATGWAGSSAGEGARTAAVRAGLEDSENGRHAHADCGAAGDGSSSTRPGAGVSARQPTKRLGLLHPAASCLHQGPRLTTRRRAAGLGPRVEEPADRSDGPGRDWGRGGGRAAGDGACGWLKSGRCWHAARMPRRSTAAPAADKRGQWASRVRDQELPAQGSRARTPRESPPGAHGAPPPSPPPAATKSAQRTLDPHPLRI